MRTDLREFLRKLRLTLAVTMMTVKALQRQAAENDEDLALVLQRHVCDVLGIEIDKWEACLQA